MGNKLKTYFSSLDSPSNHNEDRPVMRMVKYACKQPIAYNELGNIISILEQSVGGAKFLSNSSSSLNTKSRYKPYHKKKKMKMNNHKTPSKVSGRVLQV